MCINSAEEGGLNMIDLQSKLRSLKLSWIPKYLKYNDQPWMYLFDFWVNKIGPLPLCFRFNCSRKDMSILCKKNRCHLSIQIYCDIRFTEIHNVDISREILWYNSHIKFDREILLLKDG